MKSPRSPRPSGDRKLARLFMEALTAAGFSVQLATEYRSWQRHGDAVRAGEIKQQALAIAADLIAGYRQLPFKDQPVGWFTYHLYHKAPDWIGPAVCAALHIPYFVAEASIAPKQQHGAWSDGYQHSVAAVRQAALLFSLNPQDNPALEAMLNAPTKIVRLLPFVETTDHRLQRNPIRHQLASKLRIDPNRYWLLSVAMMRHDIKLESYRQLAKTIELLQRKDWVLLIVGDGAAELMVRDYFRFDLDRRINFLGKRDAAFIQKLMLASDLMVWPAINEAIGMVVLEAMCMGLPAVCGNSGGIAQLIPQQSGVLIPQPEADSAPPRFADTIEMLLANPLKLASMSAAASARFNSHHTLQQAAKQLKQALQPCLDSARGQNISG